MIDTTRSHNPDLSTLLTLSAADFGEAEALRVIETVSQTQAMLDAVRLNFIHRYATLHDDDLSARNELAYAEKVSVAKAGNDLALAYTLVTRLPETFTHLAAGMMNHHKTTQVARATGVLTDDDARAVDIALYPRACDKTPRQLSQLLRTLIPKINPQHTTPGAKKRAPGRRIYVGHNTEMSWLHIFMASADVAVIDRRLAAISDRLRDEGDYRTDTELRAEVARDLLLAEYPDIATAPVVDLDEVPQKNYDDTRTHSDRFGGIVGLVKMFWTRTPAESTHPETDSHDDGSPDATPPDSQSA